MFFPEKQNPHDFGITHQNNQEETTNIKQMQLHQHHILSNMINTNKKWNGTIGNEAKTKQKSTEETKKGGEKREKKNEKTKKQKQKKRVTEASVRPVFYHMNKNKTKRKKNQEKRNEKRVHELPPITPSFRFLPSPFNSRLFGYGRTQRTNQLVKPTENKNRRKNERSKPMVTHQRTKPKPYQTTPVAQKREDSRKTRKKKRKKRWRDGLEERKKGRYNPPPPLPPTATEFSTHHHHQRGANATTKMSKPAHPTPHNLAPGS